MTRVLIAGGSAVVRAGLETIVSSGPALESVGTASGIPSLAAEIERLQPDVVLIEVDETTGNLGSELSRLGGASGSPGIVLLTSHLDSSEIAEALRSGARAVLPREAQPEEIIAAVEAAAAGLVVLHVDAVEPLLPLFSSVSRPLQSTIVEPLTPREIEVLGMLAEGSGNKAIARRLGISEHTVKFHVGSILAKLNASSRTEAVTLGLRQGLIMV